MKINIVAVALCVFLINLAGFTVFRTFVANDLTGGDATNFTQYRTSSYSLTLKKIANPAEFFSEILKGKNDSPDLSSLGFLYPLFSLEGQKTIERLSLGLGDGRDQEIFNYELNSRVLDKEDLLIKTYEALKKSSSPDLQNLASIVYPEIFTFKGSYLSFWLGHMLGTMQTNISALFPAEGSRFLVVTYIFVPAIQTYIAFNPDKVFRVIVLMGIFYAALMTFLFLLAYEFTKSIFWALIAVLIYQASPGTIKASFNLFCMPYLLDPLVMVSAFYGYVRYKQGGKYGWLALFVFIAFLGPWVREFSGAVPYIVFATEVFSFRKKRSGLLMALCIPLMIHSLYPSLFPWLLGFYKGHVFSAFSSSHAANFTTSNWPIWHLYGMLFSQIPPLLWIVFLSSIAYWLWRFLAPTVEKRFKIPLLNWQVPFKLPVIWGGFSLRFCSLLVMGVVVLAFCYSYFVVNRNVEAVGNVKWGAPLFLLFPFVALLSLRFGVFLPAYFVAMSIPFIRILLGDIHVASFTLPPLAILFSLWTRDFFDSIATHFSAGKREVILTTLLFLFGVGLADHLMNFPASAWTQKRLVEGNVRMAEWIKAHIPKHSIVIGNFFAITDLFYYAKYHFDPYDANDYHYLPQRLLTYTELITLLNNNLGVRDIYYLASDHPYYSYQVNFHSHRFVRYSPTKLEKEVEFTSSNVYSYLDPIKYFVPRVFIPQTGYQDWETDFYFNSLDVPFRRIYRADYALFKVVE